MAKRACLLLAGVLTTTTLMTAPPAAYSAEPGIRYTDKLLGTWGPNGTVRSVAVTQNRIYIAADFTKLRNPKTGKTLKRKRLAALEADSGKPVRGWHPSANHTVQSIVTHGDTIYAGGEFTQVNGKTVRRLVALNAKGNVRAGFDAGVNGKVWSLLDTDKQLYVGGDFSSLQGEQCQRVCRVDLRTGRPGSWDAHVEGGGGVRTMTRVDNGDTLILGGTFRRLGEETRAFLGSVRTDGGETTDWAPPQLCSQCVVHGVTSQGKSVYAAIGGPGGGRAVAYSTSTGSRRWVQHADGDVYAVDERNGLVYFGGHFGPTFANGTRHRLAVVGAKSGEVKGWRIDPSGSDRPGVWSVTARRDGLYLGGGFNDVGPQGQSKVAVFKAG